MASSFGISKFQIGLANNYKSGHALVYLLGVMLTIALFVFLNSTQGFVLKDILQEPKETLGYTTGTLVFYDELCSLFMVAIWGIVSDVFGKFLVFGFGFTFTCTSLFLYTYSRNVYPEMLIYRLIFAIGGSACSSMLTAMLADLSNETDRGKFAGMVGFISGVGALIGVFVLLPLPARLGVGVNGLRTTYIIVGFISVIMALVLFTTWITVLKIKRKNSILSTESITDTIHEAFDQPPLHICDKDSLVWRRISNSIVGCISAAKDPKIILGSCGNLLARSDSVSITLFLPLWVYKYYLDNNLCQIGDLNSPDFNTICRNAYVRASVLSGVTQVFALVGAPLFGYFADKFYRPIVVLFAALSAGTGYLLLAFTSNIQSNIVFAYLFLIGFGEIGLIVTSLGLVTHSSVPEHARGSVAGLASFCGALGILISSKVGGYLFDVWFLGGAFALLGMLHLLFLVVGTLAVFLEARNHGGFTMDSFRKMRAVFQE